MHKPLKDWNAAYNEGINARELADAITPHPLSEEAEQLQNSHFAEPAWPILHEAAYYGLAGEVVHSIEPHSEADPVAMTRLSVAPASSCSMPSFPSFEIGSRT
jgi:hypothetical protein